ncbi:MAG TPA: VOC family protein [Saprospiraceae bacterium]|nr:VOC family protein [Saprospiraceae bacterium]HMQ84432.1 VOC family protein [Saprospiraceae bacterium]
MSVVSNPQKITPFLWFDGQAEAAMNYYTAVFPHSSITRLNKWGAGTPFPAEWVMAGTMILNGLQIHAFDAGPQFQFNESISFFVHCKDQEEVDYYWSKLCAGGSEGQCGWLKDQFGLSWQIVPEYLGQKMQGGDPHRIGQMMQALGQMKKLVIAELDAAYNA